MFSLRHYYVYSDASLLVLRHALTVVWWFVLGVCSWVFCIMDMAYCFFVLRMLVCIGHMQHVVCIIHMRVGLYWLHAVNVLLPVCLC